MAHFYLVYAISVAFVVLYFCGAPRSSPGSVRGAGENVGVSPRASPGSIRGSEENSGVLPRVSLGSRRGWEHGDGVMPPREVQSRRGGAVHVLAFLIFVLLLGRK